MKRTGLATLVALGALPATASAQTPPPAPTPVPPAPAPATATLSVTAQDTLDGAAFTSRSFTARVVMKPYVANETAVLRVYRGKKKIRVKALTFKPVNNGTAGVAELKVKSAKAGTLAIRASHEATPGQTSSSTAGSIAGSRAGPFGRSGAGTRLWCVMARACP